MENCEHSYSVENSYLSIDGYRIFFCTKADCQHSLELFPEEYSEYEFIKDLKETYYGQ
jgi:hypothetical protein